MFTIYMFNKAMKHLPHVYAYNHSRRINADRTITRYVTVEATALGNFHLDVVNIILKVIYREGGLV